MACLLQFHILFEYGVQLLRLGSFSNESLLLSLQPVTGKTKIVVRSMGRQCVLVMACCCRAAKCEPSAGSQLLLVYRLAGPAHLHIHRQRYMNNLYAH